MTSFAGLPIQIFQEEEKPCDLTLRNARLQSPDQLFFHPNYGANELTVRATSRKIPGATSSRLINRIGEGHKMSTRSLKQIIAASILLLVPILLSRDSEADAAQSKVDFARD